MSDNDNKLQTKKRRGPTTCKNFKKKANEVKSIQFDEMSHQIGGCAKDFKSYIEVLARVKVDINIDDWKKVPEGLKNTIWEDVKKEFKKKFNLTDDKKKELVLKVTGMRWKDFKSQSIHKKHTPQL
ncbi:hypothetical protein DITRI_Ditri18aG0084700 [Diplodiscus trichospermus]